MINLQKKNTQSDWRNEIKCKRKEGIRTVNWRLCLNPFFLALLFSTGYCNCTPPQSVYEFIGGLFSIFNTQMYLNTFSREKEESSPTNAFNISGSPASLSFNCLETLQTGVRSLSPISFLLTTHPSELLQAYANRKTTELDLLVFCMYPAVLTISLFKIKRDEIRAVSSANAAKPCMDFGWSAPLKLLPDSFNYSKAKPRN